MPKTAAELVELLDLEQIDVNLFRGQQPETSLQRVFGGQVAAQALIAAARSAREGYAVHSLHSYFLLPGDVSVPIVYDVESIRDGRSFGTRRVVARQHGRPIYFLTANFQRHEVGLEHQDEMPDVRSPEDAFDMPTLIRQRDAASAEIWEVDWSAIEFRYLGNSRVGGVSDEVGRPSRVQIWLRVPERLPDDPLIHQAVFTYASDATLLGASLVPHDVHIDTPGMQMASLDHTIWFHRPFRADEWWLYDQTSPSASGGRGLSLARVFSQDGRLVATVAQEGLIRIRKTD